MHGRFAPAKRRSHTHQQHNNANTTSLTQRHTIQPTQHAQQPRQAGSASAEFFADIALSPFEAVKVAVQVRHRPPVSPSVRLSVCPSVCLSVCLRWCQALGAVDWAPSAAESRRRRRNAHTHARARRTENAQTRPGFAKGLTDGMPKLIADGGVGSLFKSLVPLWGRQIPYTMMKFGAFENTVVALYKCGAFWVVCSGRGWVGWV